MTELHRVYAWTDDGGLSPAPPAQASTQDPTQDPAQDPVPSSAPQVFDSWLVLDGAAVALAHHEQRFAHGVRALFPDARPAALHGFLAEVRDALPHTGSWWPRIEAHRRDTQNSAGTPQLVLRIRPAPEQNGDVVLWSGSSDLAAPKHPRHKGPDQPLYSQLRELAADRGATDAVLIDGDGHVLETDHSALVWWRGDTLCLPARRLPRLPSVTQEQLVALAEQAGIPVRQESVRAAELDGLEIWALNAARGVRPVSRWIGDAAPAVAPPSAAAHQWHQRWRASGAHLPD